MGDPRSSDLTEMEDDDSESRRDRTASKQRMKRAFETAPNFGSSDLQQSARPDADKSPRRPRSASFGDTPQKSVKAVRTFSFANFSKKFAKLSLVTDTVIYAYMDDDEEEDEEEGDADQSCKDMPTEGDLQVPLSSPGKEKLDEQHLAGTFKTATTMFKTLVGPGLLFMPAGMKNAGLATAVPMTLGVGFLAVYCVVLLLRTAIQLREEGHRISGFGDIGYALFGNKGKLVVNASICICQMGFCTAYCVFIAENLQIAMFEIVGCSSVSGLWAQEKLVYWIILVVIPLQIPLTWIRQLKYFALTNFLANVIILSTVLYMFICFFAKIDSESSGKVKAADPTGSLIYLGTAMYSFEGGSAMVLPIERSYQHKENMTKLTVSVMSAVVCLQASFGALAYWTFGDETESIVTISLRNASLGGVKPVIAVQILWCFAVFLTFPLQLFPAAKIIETNWFPDRRSEHKWKKNGIRCGLVGVCMGVSLAGYSSVDNLVSIIGAIGCIPLAIIFPALFHWRMATREGGPQEGQIITHSLVIVIVGLIGVAIAVIMALRSWVMSSFEYQKCDF